MTNAIDCVEQGRYCLKRFIPTRVGQTDTCVRCMQMLYGEVPEMKSVDKKHKLWS